MALTATAPVSVRKEIREYLEIQGAQEIYTGPLRENLEMEVSRFSSQAELKTQLLSGILEREGSGIVYVPTRKKAKEIAELLKKHKVLHAVYHAGLSQEVREQSQNDFLTGAAQVMIATNSFGMGIDKEDIEFVFHYGMPGNIENYLQEIGRAGRNGMPAFCHLFYGPKDYFLQNFMFKKTLPELEVVQLVYRELTSLLDERHGLGEAEALNELTARCKEDRDTVESALNFLTNEQVFSVLSSVDGSTMISGGAEGQGCDVHFWERYERVRKEKKAKLRAIYDFVKCDDDRVAFLEEYFSS